MSLIKIFSVLFCCFGILSQHVKAQYGNGMEYFPNVYGGILGRPSGYSSYGNYPQYPMFGSYPCYTSVFCGGGGGYGFGYGGYPYYQNGYNTAFTRSSSISGFSTSYGLTGGFFG